MTTTYYDPNTWRWNQLVRRLNRKAAFLRFVDRHIGWGIALCYVAMYGCIRGVAGA